MLVTNSKGKQIEVGPKMDLRRADISGANLRGAYLSEANLSGANLSGADLCDADLRGANLSGADLCGANLAKTTLCNAVVDGAMVRPEDIGGPGHILCALTDTEWQTIQQHRSSSNA